MTWSSLLSGFWTFKNLKRSNKKNLKNSSLTRKGEDTTVPSKLSVTFASKFVAF